MSTRLFDWTGAYAMFDKLASIKDYRQLVYATERMYGTGGFGNSLAVCIALEGACEIHVPQRAQYIRTILMELSLIQENLLRLAAIGESIGLESLSMKCWTQRERILEILEALTGGRMVLSMNRVGGVRRDFNSDILAAVPEALTKVENEAVIIKELIAEDRQVASRLKGVGVLTYDEAYYGSVTGPAAKGSGVESDRRALGEYGVYHSLDYKPVIEMGGDCHARTMVKIREVIQSCQLAKKAIETIPDGSIGEEMPKTINGEWIARVEQADGVDTYYVKGRDSAFLEAVGIRKADEANERIIERVTDFSSEDEALVRLTLGLDECLGER